MYTTPQKNRLIRTVIENGGMFLDILRRPDCIAVALLEKEGFLRTVNRFGRIDIEATAKGCIEYRNMILDSYSSEVN